ncbi:hypothetical protein [Streptomyces niveus]|uniref:hypothetical protein n=1 Tax=Streptomyces niveus TaxID=193462 RepID=UPI0034207799
MSIDPTPHRAYIAAVALGLDNADQRYAVKYRVHSETEGLLTATIEYARIGEPVPPGPLGGLTLRWDQRAGWRSTPIGTPDGPQTPLLVRVLASPLAVREKLPLLLEGRTHELVKSVDQWPMVEAHRRLIGRLDVIEDLTDAGWEIFSSPVLPVAMRRGSVVWHLTAHHDIWREDPPGADWRDSRLRAPGWFVDFRWNVPGGLITRTAHAAVARTIVLADRPPARLSTTERP